MKKTPEKDNETRRFDDVLKRMLGTPPKQHKDEKHPKPEQDKPAKKKPA